MLDHGLSRRKFLGGVAVLGAGVALPRGVWGRDLWRAATVRLPGSLPDPSLPMGTDTLPQIKHIVVVMMENHSYDNYLGTLERGDGFRLGPDGKPLDANPDGEGQPDACVPHAVDVSAATHRRARAGMRATSRSGRRPTPTTASCSRAVPSRWATGRARTSRSTTGSRSTFPLCDRFFCSVLAQTYPNRRFLLAGSAGGIISTTTDALRAPEPPNGSIFDRLDANDISWTDYFSDLPGVAVLLPPPHAIADQLVTHRSVLHRCRGGRRCRTSRFVDPAFEGGESEENPDDIQVGESFVARVVNAVMQRPRLGRDAADLDL